MDETVQEFYENAQQPHISSRAREEQRDELFSGELQCLTLSVQTEQSRAGPLEVPNYSTYTLAHSLSFSASPKTQWHADNRERYERRPFHSHAAINKEAAPLEGRSKVSAQHIAREYAISSS
ncbi:hypothetical protein DPX16_3738 [Anabarilius grahami]|uniref:Uncharacterized protein n=2 Tax=Xenocypridinae TaxID=2743747 RepID=A0A3N0XV67_ANAGA|nr:hypothetical protein DPX16_3738 [Anabarilius grahami]